jgi:predicted enzyme related to lactoylglutathione lyase
MDRPTYGNGKICYLEIPATDIDASSRFYAEAFDWRLRKNNAGDVAFDDGVGEVSGMWVTGRPPLAEPGIVISIMVDDIPQTLERVVHNGGRVVRPFDPNARELIAWFADPAGNVMGLYQQRH